MPAKFPTRTDFAYLVLDLRAATRDLDEEGRAGVLAVPRRAVAGTPWHGRPWRLTLASVDEAAELTGLARESVRSYDKQADRARRENRATGRVMPASVPTKEGRKWMIGELAAWMAGRDDKRAIGAAGRKWDYPRDEFIAAIREMNDRDGYVTARRVSAELAAQFPDAAVGFRDFRLAGRLIKAAGLKSAGDRELATDEEIAEVARRAVKEHGQGVSRDTVVQLLKAERLFVGAGRVSPALARARVEHLAAACVPRADGELAALESDRPDGLVTAKQVAEAFGVGASAISNAITRRQLTPVQREKLGAMRRALFDPERLAVRADGKPGPVDAGSEWAARFDVPAG